MIYFDHAPGAGHEDKFEIVSAAYRLRKSACFLKSAGLTCTTCHNPHDVPRGKDAVAQHRERCMGCHELLPRDTHPNPASSDCAGCHMPKRRTEDAVQVVMTDHFIRRKPLEHDSLAPLKEKAIAYRGNLVIYYPENLPAADREAYLGIALAAHGADRPRGISKLEHLERSGSVLDPKIKVELANAYMAEGRTGDAIAAYRAALDADPEIDKARYNLAQALERSGELIEAQRQYEHLITARSGFAEAHFGLARLLSRTSGVDGARAAVQASLRLRPMYIEARNFMAVEFLAKGDWAQARLELEEALRIEPDSVEALNNLAKVFISEGKQQEALELVNRAARLDPENAEIRLNFGRLLLITGHVQRAITELKKLVGGKPGFAEAHLSLGIAYGESGRMDAAIKQFREVLRLQPNHPDAQQNLDVALQLRSNQ
jgi:predicted CXXCH cytochrome family protein